MAVYARLQTDRYKTNMKMKKIQQSVHLFRHLKSLPVLVLALAFIAGSLPVALGPAHWVAQMQAQIGALSSQRAQNARPSSGLEAQAA